MLIRFMIDRLSAIVQWRRTLILQLYHFVFACQNQNSKWYFHFSFICKKRFLTNLVSIWSKLQSKWENIKMNHFQSDLIMNFQMMYRNVTYSQRDQMSKNRNGDQDWTSISFGSNSPLMDDLSQFQIEPPSDGPAFNDANWAAWWGESSAAEGTKKDLRKWKSLFMNYQICIINYDSISLIANCFIIDSKIYPRETSRGQCNIRKCQKKNACNNVRKSVTKFHQLNLSTTKNFQALNRQRSIWLKYECHINYMMDHIIWFI